MQPDDEQPTADAPAGAAPAGAALSQREVMVVIGGMLVALFLAAVDSTIVATALPTMAGDLGSVDQLPWVLTAYLLTSTASTPLWGKFSDLWGRRRVFQVAIVWYLAASAVAGASQDMVQLVGGRAIQGIGGGGIMALTFVIIGDLVSPRERGRYMGWFTGTFTSAALVGPLIGGFFVDQAHWRWIFYAKIPFGLVALVIIGRVLRLPFTQTRRRVDVEGAALLVVGVTALVLVMTWGGERLAWTSPALLGLVALFAAATAGFVWHERRAEEPIIPPRLFRSRIVTLVTITTFASGATMMAANAFLPLFLQVVTGTSATASGMALAPMMIMLTIGSIVAGNMMTRYGRYKPFVVIGPLLTAVALVVLTGVDQSTTVLWLMPALVLLGVGLGFIIPTTTTIAQNALPQADLGVGTATITFARNLGSTIGIGLYGAALAARIDSVLAARIPADAGIDTSEILSTPEDIHLLPDQIRDAVVEAIAQGTATVFTVAVPVAVLMVIAGALIPDVPLQSWGARGGDDPATPAVPTADRAGGPPTSDPR